MTSPALLVSKNSSEYPPRCCITLDSNYLGGILDTIKESDSKLTAPAIMKIMFESKNDNGIKELKKYKESVFPVFTRAYQKGILLRDKENGYVSIVK